MQKHRWSAPKYKWAGIKPEKEKTIIDRATKQYCIKCGSMKISVSPTPRWCGPWKVFMRPYDGILKEVGHIPKCEGLPSNYEMPIGA